MKQLANASCADAQGVCDVVVRTALEYVQDHRGTLAVGQAVDRGQYVREPLAALDRVLHELGRLAVQVELEVLRITLAEGIERGVVSDAVEPGTKLGRRVATREAAVRVDEGLLHRVLHLLWRQQPAAVAQERWVVTSDDRLERPLVAGPGQFDQPTVALPAEHGCPRQADRPREAWRHRSEREVAANSALSLAPPLGAHSGATSRLGRRSLRRCSNRRAQTVRGSAATPARATARELDP